MNPLRDRLAELGPRLRERAPAAEGARQLPRDTISDCLEAGLFRAFVPKRFGGDEATLSQVLEAVVRLASDCSSTAWVCGLFAVHNLAVAWCDEQAQAEVWRASPDSLIASSVAPTGKLTAAKSGFRLDGRWSFVSGIDHAEWIMFGGLLERSATPQSASPLPPEYCLLLVPRGDVTIVDDWHVAGLQATGSKSAIVRDVFVPEHRMLSFERLEAKHADGRIDGASAYRAPWRAVFDSTFPAIALGTALANVEGYRASLAARTGARSERYASSPMHLARLADAAANVAAALALYRQNVATLERSIEPNPEARNVLSSRISYEAAFVVDRCSHAVYRLFRGSGGRALQTSNVLQRYFRDLHAMTQHAALDLDRLGPIYGSTLLPATEPDRAGRSGTP